MMSSAQSLLGELDLLLPPDLLDPLERRPLSLLRDDSEDGDLFLLLPAEPDLDRERERRGEEARPRFPPPPPPPPPPGFDAPHLKHLSFEAKTMLPHFSQSQSP